jgi:hypothetical protein
MKKIVDEKVELVDKNTIRTTTITEENRYVGQIHYGVIDVATELDNFKTDNKCWVAKKRSGENFDCLDTGENWEPKGDKLQEDLTHFQLYLDQTYGKDEYEAFALGAYVHSGVSFSISKGPDNRCRWDSATVGFIGMSKSSVEYWNKREGGINEYASLLSDMWNGTLGEICIYDKYNEEIVDSCWTSDSYKEIAEWKAKMKEEYGVDEDNYKEEDY